MGGAAELAAGMGQTPLTEEQRQATCTFLDGTKPSNCPNPIAYPVSPDYGHSQYANGSGLARLIALSKSSIIIEAERTKLNIALFTHTIHATFPTSPMDIANMQLASDVAGACAEMTVNTVFPGVRDATRKCHESLEVITREAGGTPFAHKLAGWLDLNKSMLASAFSISRLFWLASSPPKTLCPRNGKLSKMMLAAIVGGARLQKISAVHSHEDVFYNWRFCNNCDSYLPGVQLGQTTGCISTSGRADSQSSY